MKYLGRHNYENWVLAVFSCGAVVAGGLAFYLLDPAWEKWLRFSIIVVAAVIGGCIFGYFNQMLARLAQVAVILGVIFFIGRFFWSII